MRPNCSWFPRRCCLSNFPDNIRRPAAHYNSFLELSQLTAWRTKQNKFCLFKANWEAIIFLLWLYILCLEIWSLKKFYSSNKSFKIFTADFQCHNHLLRNIKIKIIHLTIEQECPLQVGVATASNVCLLLRQLTPSCLL